MSLPPRPSLRARTHRSGRARAIAVGALLGLAALTTWGLWWTSRFGSHAGPGEAAPTAQPPRHESARADRLATPDNGTRESARVENEPAEPRPLGEVWSLEGAVVFPPGFDRDESVFVRASGRNADERRSQRAAVAADGRFRLAIARELANARIELDAEHLFLPEPAGLEFDGDTPRPLRLEPALAGALRGRMVLPAGCADRAPELVGVPLRALGAADVDLVLDQDLGFELRGLDPSLTYALSLRDGPIGELFVPGIRVRAGETLNQDFELSCGIRVSGVVRAQVGELREARVAARSMQPERPPRLQHTRVAADGSYELRGVDPGTVSVHAGAKGMLTAGRSLGVLRDGEDQASVDFALEPGKRIEGRVTFPDGRSASQLRVVLRTRIPGESREEMAGALTDGDGRFRYESLPRADHTLLAVWRAPPQPGAREVEWRAVARSERADDETVDLTLVAASSVSGRVVDDRGIDFDAARVVAIHVRELDVQDAWLASKPVAIELEPAGFRIDGLHAGVFEVTVSVLGHEQPNAVTLVAPTSLAPLELVATRFASLRGRVVDEAGQGIDGARVVLAAVGEAESHSGGVFEWSELPAGLYTLHASFDGFEPARGLDVRLQPGERRDDVELVLRGR